MLTAEEEPRRLALVQRLREVRAVAVQDRLAPLEQRDLQVVVVQDLDERSLESRDLQPILYPSDNANRVDLCTDVLEQAAYEG